ncbi:UMP kinase [Candidatus Woesearchaeota archaeon]|nr:UMP kinase [Candidatus Woesearchaeota archaeon]MBT4783217.1 UMP kinase [Candidatus Woesearchaeota archaeon]MBT7786595.1 UMP kinase [Candidatus Woesearchaeota archaeon]
MKVEVLSVGGSLLFDGCSVNYSYIKKLKKLITSFRDRKFVIVIGGGTIARTYINALEHFNSNKEFLSHFGIAITRTNARMMANAFGKCANTRHLPTSIKEVNNMLAKHKVVFCGGLRYAPDQTSDGTAAAIAHRLKTRFINVTNVNGLYSKNPKTCKLAKFISDISFLDFHKRVMAMKYHPGQHFVLDQNASKIIKKNNIPTYIVGESIPNLKKLLRNEKYIGTIIH